jgi:hypothetical protein
MTELQIVARDYRTVRQSHALTFIYREPPEYRVWLEQELAGLEAKLRAL